MTEDEIINYLRMKTIQRRQERKELMKGPWEQALHQPTKKMTQGNRREKVEENTSI